MEEGGGRYAGLIKSQCRQGTVIKFYLAWKIDGLNKLPGFGESKFPKKDIGQIRSIVTACKIYMVQQSSPKPKYTLHRIDPE